MREADRILEQVERSLRGGAWSGPSVLEALVGVNASSARSRPLIGAHSIWEIVLHLGGAYQLVLRRLADEPAELSLDVDWPAVPDSALDDAWLASVQRLESLHVQVREAVARLHDSELERVPPTRNRFTVYDHLHGLAQHNLYHAGQIVLLARARSAGV